MKILVGSSQKTKYHLRLFWVGEISSTLSAELLYTTEFPWLAKYKEFITKRSANEGEREFTEFWFKEIHWLIFFLHFLLSGMKTTRIGWSLRASSITVLLFYSMAFVNVSDVKGDDVASSEGSHFFPFNYCMIQFCKVWLYVFRGCKQYRRLKCQPIRKSRIWCFGSTEMLLRQWCSVEAASVNARHEHMG